MQKSIELLMEKIDALRASSQSRDDGMTVVGASALSEVLQVADAIKVLAEHGESSSSVPDGAPCLLLQLIALPAESVENLCRLAVANGYSGSELSILFETLEAAGWFIGSMTELRSENTRKDLRWFQDEVDAYLVHSKVAEKAVPAPSLPAADDSAANITYPKVIVLCTNERGLSEFYSCSPEVSADEFAMGVHLARAEESAVYNGYVGPMLSFDMSEPAANQLLSLGNWLSGAAA